MSPLKLVLVGAGHTHLHLLRHADQLHAAGYRITLLAPDSFRYSGVAVATSTGALPTNYGRIDVTALARAKRVDHVVGWMQDVDSQRAEVSVSLGERQETTSTPLSYDVLSLNLGSQANTAGIDITNELLRIKPLEELALLQERIAARHQESVRITIIGGGATALELAGNLSVAPSNHIQILEAGPRLGASLPRKASRAATRLLKERGVAIALNASVQNITARETISVDGTPFGHDIAVLATGLNPAPAPEPLGGPHGIPVRATLQHRDDDRIYACGDAADFLPGRLPKLGVYGVRQGPVLLANLIARSQGQPQVAFNPQIQSLQILDLGGHIGLGIRGQRWWLGRLPLHLKRAIDRRWLSGVQTYPAFPENAGSRSR